MVIMTSTHNFQVLFLLFGVYLCCASQVLNNNKSAEGDGLSSPRIVGGFKTTIARLPYQITIQRSTLNFCGGVIITPLHILTAAHCMTKYQPQNLTIRAGSTFRDREGVVVPIQMIFIHPGYNKSIGNDIAILKLSSALQFNNYVKPIPVAGPSFQVPTGSRVWVAGWGATKEHLPASQLPHELHVADMQVMDEQDCKKIYSVFTEHMLCVGSNATKDSCSGDSGGPLVMHGVLVGVISKGFGCARPNRPGIYTRVSSMTSFIDHALRY